MIKIKHLKDDLSFRFKGRTYRLREFLRVNTVWCTFGADKYDGIHYNSGNPIGIKITKCGEALKAEYIEEGN